MNEREKEVFRIIVNHYLNSGESVGSRTLEKKYNMGVSSATIRNVMADLEDMGLITKTHTSSGRIPTLDGYKIYIEELMVDEELADDVKEYIFNTYKKRINKSDIIFKETVKLLSDISSCMSVLIEPSSRDEDIKKIQFIKITDRNVYVVAIMKNNIIKTATLYMNTFITEENINSLNEYINNLLQTTHKRFTIKDLERFLKTIGEADFVKSDNIVFENNKVFVEGKEYLIYDNNDIGKTIEVLKTINDTTLKDIFKSLAEKNEYNDEKVNVVFGKNLNNKNLEDYVLIFSCFEFGDEKGILGVIAQSRIEYSKIVAMIKMVITMLKKMLNNNLEKIYIGYKD